MSAGPPDGPPESIRRQVRRPGRPGPVAVIEGLAGRRSVIPFAILLLGLLTAGLVVLLLLNTALDRGAFQIQAAQKRQAQLTDRQQELQLRLAGVSAPGALASQAAALGLVPNPRPVFLNPADGNVLGIPTPAPTTAAPSPSPSPSPSLSQSAQSAQSAQPSQPSQSATATASSSSAAAGAAATGPTAALSPASTAGATQGALSTTGARP